MRILVWHGYLLSGTGSNIYTQALVREWARAGHDVTVFSQEPHPERFDLAGATAVRPRIGPVLPVFVLDRYEGLEARLLQDLTQAERDAYVEANAAALREHLPADLVFANHVLLGAPVGAATGARYAVKAHGSELEYSMRGNDELSAWGRESLKDAASVYVGSAPHQGGARGRRGPRRPRARGSAGRRRRRVPARGPGRRARGAARRAPQRSAEPR